MDKKSLIKGFSLIYMDAITSPCTNRDAGLAN